MPGGSEGSYCSANEPASISGHGSASQQSESVVNALKVTLLRYSPCKTSCLFLNMCHIVLAAFLWAPPGCCCHQRGCFSVCHSLHLWAVCSLGQGQAMAMGRCQLQALSGLLTFVPSLFEDGSGGLLNKQGLLLHLGCTFVLWGSVMEHFSLQGEKMCCKGEASMHGIFIIK